MAGRPQPNFASIGATNSVQPYCRLAIIDMQMMPTTSCTQRVVLDARPLDTASLMLSAPVSRSGRRRPVGQSTFSSRSKAASWYVIFLTPATPARQIDHRYVRWDMKAVADRSEHGNPGRWLG